LAVLLGPGLGSVSFPCGCEAQEVELGQYTLTPCDAHRPLVGTHSWRSRPGGGLLL